MFDDDDDDDDGRLLTPLPKHVMTLGRKYKESSRSSVGNVRRDNYYNYRTTEKIQEEPGDDLVSGGKEDTDNAMENGSISEGTSISVCNSNANLIDTTTTSSGVSARSCETSPTESSSNLGDYTNKSIGKSDHSPMSFESRLLAAENLIKESKLKNLTPQRFNPNLSCNYKDTDKCDKEALITASSPDSSSTNSIMSKRRSCIPSLRLRSGSLTREPSVSADCRKSFTGSQDALAGNANQERSILSKFFRSSSKEIEPKNNNKQDQKPKQHRISRFLRPDFFDTPREESQYVKEKEAQKAAENERRKSRFMRRKSENKEIESAKGESAKDERICKEQKNEMNTLQRDKLDSVVASSASSSSSEVKSKNEDKEKAKVERASGAKSGFLHSLEKKLERLRVSDETTASAKSMMNGGDRKERECSAPPVTCPSAELTGAKRTLSVENLSLDKNAEVKSVSSAKGRMTSMLGLFKTNADTKQNGSGRSQNAIMSRLKRSPPKCAKSTESEEDSATSRIPTKFVKADNKSGKKMPENKKSPEKVTSEFKRSPPKEKPREKEMIVKEKRPLMEKQSRELKRAPEKIVQLDSSADKTKLQKAESPKKLLDESDSQRIVDNKHTESIISGEDKKLMKTKKNISSLSKNGSIAKIDKSEDIDKKTKKLVKSKESAEKDEINGTKKKRIVRVVKKVVKKSSDSSESKSDEKEKSSKLLAKKKPVMKKESSPEAPNVMTQDLIKKNNLDDQTIAKSSCLKQMESDVQKTSFTKSGNASEHLTQNTDTPSKVDITENQTRPNKSDLSSTNQTSSVLQNASNSNINQTKQSPEQHRPSRAGLKLDLSKIPQHTFRHATPKRDSPKSGSPKANPVVGSPKSDISAENGDKLIECLSKMTHHANITGNKIIIDKPLRAKDVAELKREVTECVRIMENHMESRNDCSGSQTVDDCSTFDSVSEKPNESAIDPPKEITDNAKVAKESPSEECLISEMFSPEEPESFDSWSICSADLNHNRGDLHSPLLYSPTSPTSYSLFMRGDSSESVIDRIRRRSFYSRFNDRKRPSLTAPPPGVTSATLPRRFSLNSSRERERSRLYSYGVSRTK